MIIVMRSRARSKILVGFLVYGLAVGLLSVWWWGSRDSMFLPNIPGELLGERVYDLSIKIFGNPHSPQAHFTIPWVLRIPQVFVPVSVLFWSIIGLVIQMIHAHGGSEMKFKKYYLIFLVLYLLALILAGANRLVLPNTFLTRAWGFIWGLMPSQTAGWWAISGIVLVILIILGFVAGCKLIAYFMREEKDQIAKKMLLRWLVGVLLTLLIWIILLVWRRSDYPYSSRSWLFGFCFIMVVIGVRMLLSKKWKWLWRSKKERDQWRE